MIQSRTLVSLATVLVGLTLPLLGQTATTSTSTGARLPNLAVMRLESSRLDTADLDVLRDALTVELQNSGRVRVMERSQMNSILAEQGFQKTGSCDASDCAVEVGRLLAVDRMVLGSAGKLGETWSVTLRLVDVQTGEVTASVRDTRAGTIEVLLSQSVPKLASDLVATLGAPSVADYREEDYFRAQIMVRDRIYRTDSGNKALQALAKGLPAQKILSLNETGSMSLSWGWANFYPLFPIGTILQKDWTGLGWIAVGWTPTLMAGVAGASNAGIAALGGYVFQVSRPIWFSSNNNRQLRRGLLTETAAWIPAPTLQLANGTLVPALAWTF